MMNDYGGFVPPPSMSGVDNYGDEFIPHATCAHRGLPAPDLDNVYNEAELAAGWAAA